MNEIVLRSDGGNLLLDFNRLEDWESFELIAEKLHKLFFAKILEKIDGPESRIWLLEIDTVHITLHNNPYGNYLKATSQASSKLLLNIYNNWTSAGKT